MVISVLLADDHGVLRDGVQRLLEANADIKVVATADDGREAVEKAAELQPDVVVMDISMPDINGIEATRRIADRAPATAVAILSMHSSSEMVREAFAAGARGYVLKESAGDEVVRAVRTLAAGRRYVGEGVAHKVLAEDTASGLERLHVRGQHVIIVTLPRLMDHMQSRHPAQQRTNRTRHRLIDCPSSLASTEYEQSR